MRRRPPLAGFRERLWPVLATGLLLLAIVALGTLGPGSLHRTITDGLIKLVVVVGMYIFIGNSGVMSFGHTSFMAIGAYVSAWLTMRPTLKRLRFPDLPDFIAQSEFSMVPAALGAGAAASVAALAIGIPLMRLSGISASIGTFAVLAVTISVFGNWSGLTGGKSSLIGVPLYTTMWVALAWAMIAIGAAQLYQNSRFGLQLRASREDGVAARATGVNVHRQRLGAFVLSAFFVAIGGVLHGHFLGILTVDAFYLNLTFLTLAMLVIGGINSLSGAVVGVVAVSFLLEGLRRAESGFSVAGLEIPSAPGLSQAALAIAMLLILVFRPAGLTGGRELPLPRALIRLAGRSKGKDGS
jgi:branched-chain amino acid transport system permease protein